MEEGSIRKDRRSDTERYDVCERVQVKPEWTFSFRESCNGSIESIEKEGEYYCNGRMVVLLIHRGDNCIKTEENITGCEKGGKDKDPSSDFFAI